MTREILVGGFGPLFLFFQKMFAIVLGASIMVAWRIKL
nr:MAG TPA: hypothetical protein [Caudoviricetes sp.]